MADHLDLDALATLVAVADTGGFTAAGQRLGRTQSAVSGRIRELELALGCRLVIRSRRGATPTEAGERLLSHARRLLAIECEARAELAGDRAQGRLRLGVPDDYVDVYLRPLIMRFAEAHPRVELEVQCELSKRIEPAVAAGELDLAVITQDPARPRGELLRREPLHWVAARGHRPELNPVLPLGLFSEGCRGRPRILAALEGAGRAYRLVFSSTHTPGLLSAVEAGLCVSAIAESAVPPGLRVLGPADGLPPLFEVSVAMVMAPGAGAAARHFARALREAMTAPRLPFRDGAGAV